MDSLDRRVRLEVDREAVTCSHFLGPAAEAEHWEPFVVVVGLNRAANAPEGLLVLIRILAAVMERGRLMGLPITASVVDGGDEADLPSRVEVVEEGGRRRDLKLLEHELTVVVIAIQVRLALRELVHGRLEELEAVIDTILVHDEGKSNAHIHVTIANCGDGERERAEGLPLAIQFLINFVGLDEVASWDAPLEF